MAERPMIKIAVPAVVLDSDPRAAVARARELGVEGVELEAYSGQLRLPDLSGSGRREFRHMLASQGRELAAVRVDCGPRGLGPGADVDRVLNGIERAIEVGRALGAPVINFEVGPLPEPAREIAERPKVTKDLLGALILPDVVKEEPRVEVKGADPAVTAQVDAAFAELARRADRYAVPVAFHSELSSYAAVERLLKAAACPWFGVDWDPVSVLRDDWGTGENLSRLGGWVRHVRARDATRGADRRTRPATIGKGDVNWQEVMGLLDEAGYHSWLTIDPTELADRTAAVRAGVEYLTRV